MKALSFIVLLTLLVSNQGCSTAQPKPVVETHYIKQEIIQPQPKPKANDFQLLQIEFQGKTFYALEEEQAKLMAVNWLMYKEWAETNYEILDTLYKNSK